MENCQDDERLFFRSVGDQKLANRMKAEWSRCKVHTDVAEMRKGNERANCFMDFAKDAVRRVNIV